MSTVRHVYFAQGPEGLVKIGASTEPDRRVKALSNAIGADVKLLGVIPCAGCSGERRLHKQFADARVPDADRPTTEWFRPVESLMAFIGEEASEYRRPLPSHRQTWLERFMSIGHEPYVDVREAADFLGYSVATVRRKAKAGEIPHYKLGGKSHLIRFKITEIGSHRRDRRAA